MFLRPTSWPEALALRAAHPQAVPVLGGTDLMPEVQHGRRALPAVLDLTRVAGIADLEWEGPLLRLGAGVTWARLLASPPARMPALLQAADEIGTPVLRLRGTIGGHVCAAWANGDALAPLLAAGAEVELRSARGSRRVPLAALLGGHRRCLVEPDELVAAVLVAPAGRARGLPAGGRPRGDGRRHLRGGGGRSIRRAGGSAWRTRGPPARRAPSPSRRPSWPGRSRRRGPGSSRAGWPGGRGGVRGARGRRRGPLDDLYGSAAYRRPRRRGPGPAGARARRRAGGRVKVR
jgi:hypothetical protein